jgi:hypothetical protein
MDDPLSEKHDRGTIPSPQSGVRLTPRERDVLAEMCRRIVDADDLFTEPA